MHTNAMLRVFTLPCNAYKCEQGGEGGSEHGQKYAFCTQVQLLPVFSHKIETKLRDVSLHMNVFDPC